MAFALSSFLVVDIGASVTAEGVKIYGTIHGWWLQMRHGEDGGREIMCQPLSQPRYYSKRIGNRREKPA